MHWWYGLLHVILGPRKLPAEQWQCITPACFWTHAVITFLSAWAFWLQGNNFGNAVSGAIVQH